MALVMALHITSAYPNSTADFLYPQKSHSPASLSPPLFIPTFLPINNCYINSLRVLLEAYPTAIAFELLYPESS